MPKLWDKKTEIEFFEKSMSFATPEQLFYISDENRYLAYWPKKYKGKKNTLQSRNALIGDFTERWTRDLIQKVIDSKGLFAVQGALCKEIALPNNSPADVVISKASSLHQKPEDILAIIEVKMSVVWNWELKGDKLICLGDYKTHQGNPGLLRSDSMLKAIGKSINIRVSSFKASNIPIVIMGNTPITSNYYSKVDHLKVAGIIQGFCSVNPKPLDNDGENIKKTKEIGFCRYDSFDELQTFFDNLLSEKRSFFSSMKSKKELGHVIELANQEDSYEKKAERFLNLIRE